MLKGEQPRDLREIQAQARSLIRPDGSLMGAELIPVALFILFVASLRTGGWAALQDVRPLPELVAFGVTILAMWGIVGVSVWRHGPTRERVPMSLRELLEWFFVWGSILVAVGVTLLYGEGTVVDLANVPAAAALVWVFMYQRRKGKAWPYLVSLVSLFGAMAVIQVGSEVSYWQPFTTGLLVSMGMTYFFSAIVERFRPSTAYGPA